MTKYSLTKIYFNLKTIQKAIELGLWKTDPRLQKMTIEEVEDLNKTINTLEERQYNNKRYLTTN